MKAVNPRDVALVFRKHTRSIHSKVAADDPNLLKLSIACAKVGHRLLRGSPLIKQVEQWTEHHYPSFLQIGGAAGSASTSIDPMSRDARVALFAKISNEAKEKIAAEKREAFMADLKARGIIKDRSPEEQAEWNRKQAEMTEDSPPWLLIIGGVLGILASMVALGFGIVYLIMKYADVSDVSGASAGDQADDS